MVPSGDASVVSSVATEVPTAPGSALGALTIAEPPSRWTDLHGFVRSLTVESLAYIVIFFLAVGTRFWDLGSRALHHDESLHAYFSWQFAQGNGYEHDPLMHGPFLFIANAFIYWLFGDSDATSRVLPAIFGTALVMLPWFLRGPRQLGRWGALATSMLLLCAPAILYQSRYIRHDIYTLVGSMVLLISVARYVEVPQRRWLITAAAAIAFLLTNHEIVFGLVAIFIGVLGGALLIGPLRRLIPVVIGTGVLALAVMAFVPSESRPLPTIPWESPTTQDQMDFWRALLIHPATISLVAILVLAVIAARIVLRPARDPNRLDEGWVASLLGNEPSGSVGAAVNAAWADKSGLLISLAVFATIFIVFFTTLFTNPRGLLTGTVATDGTLLYWLGQHDVRRGEQPWFYYLVLYPQYEPIAAILGTITAAAVAMRGLLVLFGKRVAGPKLFFLLLVATWYGGIFVALSWAGEKMPWLIVHIALPGLVLAGAAVGWAIERWRRAVTEGRTSWAPGASVMVVWLLLCAAAWLVLAGRLSFGEFAPSDAWGGWDRRVSVEASTHWWTLWIPLVVALGLVLIGWLYLGRSRALAATASALGILVLLLQVHFAWRMVYLEGDIPKDMLIYTQTSPDVVRVVDETTALSELLNGDKSLRIAYDSEVSWPMQWYLRDFTGKVFTGETLANLQDPAVIMARPGVTPETEALLSNYTPVEYVLRWWYPEEPYRSIAIAPEIPVGRSAWQSETDPHGPIDILKSFGPSIANLATAEGQQDLYRLVMYRDLTTRIDSTRFTLWVRNDLLPTYNELRYGL